MEKLTIKEKAKAYDETLRRARKFYNDEQTRVGLTPIDLESVFPELKESEDERVKEDLIQWFNEFPDTIWRGHYKKEVLAWLEKQGTETKVEPKFKVGDFIVNGYCVGKVIALTDDAYLLDTGQGVPFSYEHNAHLWTIQDVKDGDILAEDPLEGYPSSFVAIYKKQTEEDFGDFDSYCFVGFDGKFYEGENGHSMEELHPATKEQRDILFAKMRESGYEWDDKKKELKKINVELTDFEKSLEHIMIETLECGDTRNLKADAEMLLRFVQKPAEWSEEDEKKMESIIGSIRFNSYMHNSLAQIYEGDICWLKSLKQRCTWKPSGEQIRALHNMNLTGNISYAGQGKTLIELYNDLIELCK